MAEIIIKRNSNSKLPNKLSKYSDQLKSPDIDKVRTYDITDCINRTSRGTIKVDFDSIFKRIINNENNNN